MIPVYISIIHALTLSFCTQWPVGPLDVKSYWPPQKVTGPKKDLKTLFLAIHYKSKDVNLAVIYFAVGDLLSFFQSVFRMDDKVLQESFKNHMSSVKAAGAAGR